MKMQVFCCLFRRRSVYMMPGQRQLIGETLCFNKKTRPPDYRLSDLNLLPKLTEASTVTIKRANEARDLYIPASGHGQRRSTGRQVRFGRSQRRHGLCRDPVRPILEMNAA